MTIPGAVWIAMASAIAVVPGAVAQSPDPGEASCPVTIKNGLGLKGSVGELPAGNHSNDSRTIATALTFVVRAVKMGYGPRRCEPRP